MTHNLYNYDRRAGQELRKLRQQRGITLKQAAQLTHISTPMLSRKERGEGEVNRDTIRSAITGYQLTMEESYRLWTAAGFLPEMTPSWSPSYDIRALAQKLLQSQPYPAFLTDQLDYLRAWNQSLETIWLPSEADHRPVHIIDDLLSARQRRRLGEQWEQYVLHSMRAFYKKTLLIARDPQCETLLHTLHMRYGETFVAKWNQAQNEEYFVRQLKLSGTGASIILHTTSYGLIRYVATTNGFTLPYGYEIVIYVPVDAESHDRYQQFRTTIDEDMIYFSF